ncbi:MAG: DUF1552 domain-containing protein, partial [Deltaproteobacteria bacterium]|nr:DUF1552 domain-containing protein [Deltaproteobacteria bacterium]
RLGLWFWGNGVKMPQWRPTTVGPNWMPATCTAPRAAPGIREYVNIVPGLDVKAGNERGHHSGLAAVMSGSAILPQDHPNSNYKSTYRQPTLDQQLAKEIAPTTKFRTLELGVSSRVAGGEGTTPQYLSHNGPDSPNPAEYDAGKVFDRVFAGVATTPGMAPPVADATRALRKSVLDAVKTDIARLQGKIGAADKQRLDQHLTNINSIQQRVVQASTQVVPAVCGGQIRPKAVVDTRSREDVKLRNELMSDLLAVTLACDLTRIFSVHFSGSFGSTVYWQADAAITAGHHDMTHNEAGAQPQVQACTTFMMAQLAYLLTKLKSTPDIDGKTILDNVVILGSSDVADGLSHSYTDYPIVVAGGGSGYLKNPGVHYKGNKENTSNVLLTVMRAAGSKIASVGTDKGLSMTPCTAIESGAA